LYWLRFFYDSTLRHIEDLWIRPGAPRPLYRVTYDAPPSGRAPGLKDLRKSTRLRIDTTFLAAPSPPKALETWLEEKVESWFARHWPDV
jgi:hypothetical protein